MFLKNLLTAVDALDGMPIEIHEIAAELTKAGCQDEIIFYPDPRLDPAVLRGIHYRYTKHNGVYSEPTLTTLIVYAERLSLDWQRVACCKELIHTCDTPVERTNTEDEVKGLLDKLLGPLSTENFGVADIMATKDKLALYQALAVLFPENARLQALEYLNAGGSIAKVAEWIVLPVSLVEIVVSEEWPGLRDMLINL